MFLCPYCKEKEYPKIDSLRIHCAKTHKISSKQMYIDVVLNGIEPVCECGCGSSVKFLDTSRGFSRYVMGHNSKVEGNNNFRLGDAHEKSLTTRKKMIENGEYKPFQIKETGMYWMQGKTKDNDERLKQMSETIKEKHGKQRSENMKENRLNGTIPSLYGKEHPQWKGGISPLYAYCHGNKKLYYEWKYPILLKNNFTCSECGASRNSDYSLILHVHHDNIKMNEIMKLISKKYDYENNKDNSEVKEKIANEVAQYHIDNNISGVVLCYDCHKSEHPKLNFKK